MASSSSIPLTNLRPNSVASYFHFLVEDPLESPNKNEENTDENGHTFPPRRQTYTDTLSWINPPWKRSLHLLLEHPTSSTGATLIHILMTFFILLSAVVTVLETVPALRGMGPQVWFGMETMLVVLFTIEYIARCVAWSGTWMSLVKWAFSFFAITDLLSVLPYYIELLLHQDTSSFFRFSILRMFRLLRVFRPFRYNHTILLTIEVMYLSVRRSQHALAAIGFFVLMVLSVWSTVLYFIERGTWDPTLETYLNSEGDPSQFSSIPAAGWFVLVTITTVGYGEITPRSLLGRLLTLPLLVFGLLLIALPSFVLGREFAVVWEGMMRRGALRGKDTDPSSPHHNHEDELHDDILFDAALGLHRGRGGSLERGEGGGGGYVPLPLGQHHQDDLESPIEERPRPLPVSTSRPSLGGRLHSNPFPSSSSSGASTSTAIASGTHTPTQRERDLTNYKLAQNQTELSKQIIDLRDTVERQGEIIARLVGLLEGRKGKERES
ncbi:hypothetical protein VKT23_018436 [Stygiomarasmius scandens]|uniref:Ion transport domain-containing protein n=1 Tax=Marasmiellus scandens TaxID=2682957 RepID=A0ABR1IS73_9AGAR